MWHCYSIIHTKVDIFVLFYAGKSGEVCFRNLTSSEERFLLLAQKYPNTGAFNEHCEFEIEGDLDTCILILYQSISMVCTRHKALRSHVVIKSAKAIIKVLPKVIVDLPAEDVSAMDGEEITNQVKRFAQFAFTSASHHCSDLNSLSYSQSNGYWQ